MLITSEHLISLIKNDAKLEDINRRIKAIQANCEDLANDLIKYPGMIDHLDEKLRQQIRPETEEKRPNKDQASAFAEVLVNWVLNMLNDKGELALNTAVAKDRRDIFFALTKNAKANIYAQDVNGRDAIDCAIEANKEYGALGWLNEHGGREPFDHRFGKASPLFRAINTGKYNSAKSILKFIVLETSVPSPTIADCIASPEFHRVVENGVEDLIDAFIEAIEKAEGTLNHLFTNANQYGHNVFHLAAIHGRATILQKLISAAKTAGIEVTDSINLLDSKQLTPLALAAGKNNTEVIKILIDAGAVVDEGCWLECISARRMEEKITVEILRMLEPKSTSVNKVKTLEKAVSLNLPGVVSYLLPFVDKNQEAVIKIFNIAVKMGHSAIVEAFVEAGIDVNARIYMNYGHRGILYGISVTALSLVCTEQLPDGSQMTSDVARANMIRTLNHKRTLQVQPNTFLFPLLSALKLAKCKLLINALLETGANVNVNDEVFSTTPLIEAVKRLGNPWHDKDDVVQTLLVILQHNPDLNTEDGYKKTALHYLIENFRELEYTKNDGFSVETIKVIKALALSKLTDTDSSGKIALIPSGEKALNLLRERSRFFLGMSSFEAFFRALVSPYCDPAHANPILRQEFFILAANDLYPTVITQLVQIDCRFPSDPWEKSISWWPKEFIFGVKNQKNHIRDIWEKESDASKDSRRGEEKQKLESAIKQLKKVVLQPDISDEIKETAGTNATFKEVLASKAAATDRVSAIDTYLSGVKDLTTLDVKLLQQALFALIDHDVQLGAYRDSQSLPSVKLLQRLKQQFIYAPFLSYGPNGERALHHVLKGQNKKAMVAIINELKALGFYRQLTGADKCDATLLGSRIGEKPIAYYKTAEEKSGVVDPILELLKLENNPPDVMSYIQYCLDLFEEKKKTEAPQLAQRLMGLGLLIIALKQPREEKEEKESSKCPYETELKRDPVDLFDLLGFCSGITSAEFFKSRKADAHTNLLAALPKLALVSPPPPVAADDRDYIADIRDTKAFRALQLSYQKDVATFLARNPAVVKQLQIARVAEYYFGSEHKLNLDFGSKIPKAAPIESAVVLSQLSAALPVVGDARLETKEAQGNPSSPIPSLAAQAQESAGKAVGTPALPKRGGTGNPDGQIEIELLDLSVSAQMARERVELR